LGARLAPGTIADGLKRIEPLLTPIYEAIRDRQTQSTYFQADETRWKVFVEMFSIFATLVLWKINPHKWLSWYFEECAESGGKIPSNPASFLPWNLSPDRLAELRNPVVSTSREDPP
jgi:hypothetical protein